MRDAYSASLPQESPAKNRTERSATVQSPRFPGRLDRRHHDGKIDVGETWQYSASHLVTQGDLNAGGNIVNTASVTTGQGATSSDSASVAVVQNPAMTLVETALGYHDLNNNNVADAGDVIDFSFLVHNTGNVALNNINVSDPDGTTSSTVAGSTILLLAVGASDSTSWHASYMMFTSGERRSWLTI